MTDRDVLERWASVRKFYRSENARRKVVDAGDDLAAEVERLRNDAVVSRVADVLASEQEAKDLENIVRAKLKECQAEVERLRAALKSEQASLEIANMQIDKLESEMARLTKKIAKR